MMSAALVLASWLFPSRRPAGLEPVTLRRIRADDAAALQGLVRLLSPRSRRFRFHGALNELSAATLDEFTRVDQCRHVAFVLTVTEHGAERIVGEARYVLTADPEAAEFGIALADDFQGRGLADRLLDALVDAARAGGVRRLFGDVLPDNYRMRAFMCRCGFAEVARGAGSGLIRVEREVEPLPPGASRLRFRRLRRAVDPTVGAAAYR